MKLAVIKSCAAHGLLPSCSRRLRVTARAESKTIQQDVVLTRSLLP